MTVDRPAVHLIIPAAHSATSILQLPAIGVLPIPMSIYLQRANRVIYMLSNIKDYDGSPIWDGGKRLVLFFGPPLGFHGNDEHPAEIGESMFTCATISATVCPSGFLTAGLVGMERAWCRAFRCLLRLGCLEVR